MDAHHGHLDDVGLGALDGRVDGVALGEAPHGGVVGIDVGQIAATVEERLGVALLAGGLLGLLHVGLHAREGEEVAVDEVTGLAVGDVHALGQSVGGDAVDDAEVGLFGLLALGGSHLADVLMPDAGSRGGMDVEALAEGFDHVFVFREMSHDAQFYLTVIG